MPRRRVGNFFKPNLDAVSGLTLHPDTRAWVATTRSVGGTVATARLQATDDLVKWAYGNGLRDPYQRNHRLKFWLPLACSDFNGTMVSLWHPKGVGTQLTNNGFVAGDYSVVNGLQGATTKFIASGVFSEDVSNSSVYLATDSNTDNSNGTEVDMGFVDWTSGSNYASTLASSYSGSALFEHPDESTQVVPVVSSIGFFSGVRDGNSVGLYRDSTVLSESTAAPVRIIPSGNEYLLNSARAIVLSSNTFFATTKLHRSWLIGTEITRQQAQDFAVQFLQWRSLVRV